MANEYRIVRDRYAGYEAQVRRWWFPIWLEIGTNTRSTVEASERVCREHVRSGHIVKYLGRITAPRAEKEVRTKQNALSQ